MRRRFRRGWLAPPGPANAPASSQPLGVALRRRRERQRRDGGAVDGALASASPERAPGAMADGRPGAARGGAHSGADSPPSPAKGGAAGVRQLRSRAAPLPDPSPSPPPLHRLSLADRSSGAPYARPPSAGSARSPRHPRPPRSAPNTPLAAHHAGSPRGGSPPDTAPALAAPKPISFAPSPVRQPQDDFAPYADWLKLEHPDGDGPDLTLDTLGGGIIHVDDDAWGARSPLGRQTDAEPSQGALGASFFVGQPFDDAEGAGSSMDDYLVADASADNDSDGSDGMVRWQDISWASEPIFASPRGLPSIAVAGSPDAQDAPASQGAQDLLAGQGLAPADLHDRPSPSLSSSTFQHEASPSLTNTSITMSGEGADGERPGQDAQDSDANEGPPTPPRTTTPAAVLAPAPALGTIMARPLQMEGATFTVLPALPAGTLPRGAIPAGAIPAGPGMSKLPQALFLTMIPGPAPVLAGSPVLASPTTVLPGSPTSSTPLGIAHHPLLSATPLQIIRPLSAQHVQLSAHHVPLYRPDVVPAPVSRAMGSAPPSPSLTRPVIPPPSSASLASISPQKSRPGPIKQSRSLPNLAVLPSTSPAKPQRFFFHTASPAAPVSPTAGSASAASKGPVSYTILPPSLPASPPRAPRRHMPPASLRVLERYFARERNPGREEREKLAAKVGADPRQVGVWFQSEFLHCAPRIADDRGLIRTRPADRRAKERRELTRGANASEEEHAEEGEGEDGGSPPS
ncbi:hypothetical protein DFJ74DRAFT_416616 [Hyaloraphidium curvatum]|nr:hypothetical protein DFJ74DRAFT_416616 [Hyaloraphidium curvatum]